jgi:thymidylate synthase
MGISLLDDAHNVAFLLLITAQITGKKAKKMRHHLSNVHLYENQVEIFLSADLYRLFKLGIF